MVRSQTAANFKFCENKEDAGEELGRGHPIATVAPEQVMQWIDSFISF
jgi:hypothetical protein